MPGSKKKKPSPSSCDTFVAVGLPIQCVLDRSSPQNITVFGKNSDRPKDEQHEVVFFPRKVELFLRGSSCFQEIKKLELSLIISKKVVSVSFEEISS